LKAAKKRAKDKIDNSFVKAEDLVQTRVQKRIENNKSEADKEIRKQKTI